MSINSIINSHLNNLPKDTYVVVAVSTGVDSSVLLDLCLKSGINVVIAHVNHHKRNESEIEEKYIRDFADNNNIPIRVLSYHYEKENFQAEAHDARYDFFKRVADEFHTKYIFTAHQSDDLAETIIMNILKGSNMFGYAGIKAHLILDGYHIIRPLLSYSKEEIYEYAKENNIKYFEDSSNDSDDYLRNRIRHHIIPVLKKENPNFLSSIQNYSLQLFNAFDDLRGKSEKFVKNNEFKTSKFLRLSEAEKKDVINYLLDLNEINSSNRKIDDIITLITSSKPNQLYDLGNGFKFIKSYDSCKVITDDEVDDLYVIVNENETVFCNGLTFTINSEVSPYPLNEDEILPLTIRHRVNGDSLIIGNGHKKLKDFLIDKKIPIKERDRLIVVTNENGEILFVGDIYKKKCLKPKCYLHIN